MKPVLSATLALMMIPGLLQAADTRRMWQISAFTWIKRSPAEKGAGANGHPLQVDPAALAKAMESIHFVSGSAEEPLFERTEAEKLAKAMAEALSLAGPGEDLELLSTSKRGASLLGTSLAVTARVFAVDGKLNLIVHDSRNEFMFQYNLDYMMPRFEYGSRTAAGPVVLKDPGAELRRADWIALPVEALRPAANPQSPIAGPSGEAGTVSGGSAGPVQATGIHAPSAVITTASDYTVQADERCVVFTTIDRTITLPDPGGPNTGRVLTILSPDPTGARPNLLLQCPSGAKLKSALDSFASANDRCFFDSSTAGKWRGGPISCTSDGVFWYCQ